MSESFYHLTHLPAFPEIYYTQAISTDYLSPGEVPITPTVTTGKATILYKTKFFNDLKTEFGEVRAGFVMNNPYSYYDWHTDVNDRLCAINVLLSENKGVCLYRSGAESKLNYKIQECDYTRFQPTLFNTQNEHAIINNSDQCRYILSIGFYHVTYDIVKDFLLDYKIDNYGIN